MGVVVVVVVSVDFVVVVVVVVDVVVGYSWKCFCIGQSILLLANLCIRPRENFKVGFSKNHF